MVQIKDTQEGVFGNRWKIIFTEDELKAKECLICHRKFSIDDTVYVCEICKGIWHKKGILRQDGSINPSKKWPCSHFMSDYCYYCGKVEVEE